VVTVPEEYSGADADGPVVAAIDRSDRAHLVVREAARLAEALSRPLHVVHVLAQAEFLDLGRTVVEETGQGVSMDDVRSVAADIASEAAEGEAPEATPVGLVGRPERRIVEYAREQDAGFVVASGRDQSPVGKVLFGSVTQSILLNADRPVVTTFRSS
jgi:nucleotide-binding universal stress UspA family protein